MTLADRFRALRMDITPLKESRDFRLLFSAGAIFYLGAMMTYVAIPYSLYHLTGSNFAVGAVGLVELVPLIVFGLYGGALADHADRRKILVVCGTVETALTVVLLLNALSDEPRVWLIYVVAALLASVTGLRRPSKEALLPRTVRHEQIAAANALDSFGTQAGVLVGPAIGGLILAHAGPAWCFGANAAALGFAVVLFFLLRPYPHAGDTEPPSLRGIKQGLDYALRRKDLLGTYLVDIAAMLLAMPVVIFPALATEVFQRPELLGLLYSAETVGAVVATALSGWTARVHHHGRAIVIAATLYGGCIALAGWSPNIWLVMMFLALAGGADMISAVFRATVWNQTIPDNMRGRLAGIEMLSYSLGPMGGDVRAGLVADAWSVRGSIVSGGLACVGGVLVTAAWLRDFWSYDARTDPYAVAERERRAGEAFQPPA